MPSTDHGWRGTGKKCRVRLFCKLFTFHMSSSFNSYMDRLKMKVILAQVLEHNFYSISVWQCWGLNCNRDLDPSRPQDLSTTDSMMEGTFRMEGSACRQHHLPKLTQTTNLSKTRILGKSQSIITLPFGFCNSTLANCSRYLKYVNPEHGFYVWKLIQRKAEKGSWAPGVVPSWLIKTTLI